MENLTATLVQDRTTKNTVRYQEEDTNTGEKVFPTIYIQKDALLTLGDTSPKTIRVTVEPLLSE